MNDQSVVTEAMRRAVGVEGEPKTHLVEAGAIRKFATPSATRTPRTAAMPQSRRRRS